MGERSSHYHTHWLWLIWCRFWKLYFCICICWREKEKDISMACILFFTHFHSYSNIAHFLQPLHIKFDMEFFIPSLNWMSLTILNTIQMCVLQMRKQLVNLHISTVAFGPLGGMAEIPESYNSNSDSLLRFWSTQRTFFIFSFQLSESPKLTWNIPAALLHIYST